ncbi:MAG: SIMPL domain-containing protein [Alphaproteobacteria bacterium]|nr:SIMPL domain-containing protein [Alphaproteobacteria bacterium]
MRPFLAAALLAWPAVAAAQAEAPLHGTRLDIVATGEVSGVPTLARIGAGVVTAAPTAAAAVAENATRMAAVRAALKRAGIADRDIQTSNLTLSPEYRQETPQAPATVAGYRASNEVTVTFRDIAAAGRILDALVAQGANQINGPNLAIEHPEAMLDEARVRALTAARARADLYARAAGKRVVRIVSISESGTALPTPRPMYRMAVAAQAPTMLDAGEQTLSVSLNVTFELD